jgi:Queuine tRNA-ribosyltransferase
MMQPRVLVITSCTGEKLHKPEHQLLQEDFEPKANLKKREKALREFAAPAWQMYTGAQHLRLMEGLRSLRQAYPDLTIDLKIVSAGYGLIDEDQAIVPYEVTFNGMKGAEIDAWAVVLNIHDVLEKTVQDYDLIFVLLGDNYLRAVKLPIMTRNDQTLVFLAAQTSKKMIAGLDAKSYVMTLSNQEARHYSYGLVGLKGFLFKQFSLQASQNKDLLESLYICPERFPECLKEPQQMELMIPEVITKVERKKTSKKSTKSKKQVEESEVEEEDSSEFLKIPDVPPAANAGLEMLYYIPEWDDHVDPGYDFLNSKLTPGRDPYKDEVYAHQIYDRPNYDGILVSKVVVEGSKIKRKRIEEVGIHDFIRYQGKVMGDCGAFGYIKEDVPPFDTDEILEYYESLGFDYGVSIDHLIVGGFAVPGIREQRYEITIKNAEEFIRKHRERGYKFTPMGVAQGWDPKSYADAVAENIRLGYDYIAIGGVARAPSREIIEILKEVRPHLKADTRLHLFGVARLSAIPAFRHLGVTSFDSASALRRAWLGAGANYHAMDGTMYTAVRVPPVDGHGVRVKRLLEANVSDVDTLRNLEKNALNSLRAFDAGKLGMEETLQDLLAYDELLELPKDGEVNASDQLKRRVKHEMMYRRLLADKPWRQCDCVICQQIGVEVIIFRGNDRNRRRGFHNTHIFYERFQTLLQELSQ